MLHLRTKAVAQVLVQQLSCLLPEERAIEKNFTLDMTRKSACLNHDTIKFERGM